MCRRRNGRRVAFGFFLSALVALPTSTVNAQARRILIDLQYIPTDAEEVLEKRGVIAIGGPPFEILVVVDNRPEPRDLVGENREEGRQIRVWARRPVAAWLTQVLVSSFAEWGTPHKAGAGLLLEPEVIKFFVVEEHTYKAEVTMKFRLKKRDGTDIWAGIVGGAASRFGRSLKESNYQEVISDAVLSCYSKLWADPGYRQAWADAEKKAIPLATPQAKVPAAESMNPEWARKRLMELRDAGFDEAALAAWVKRVDFLRPFSSTDMLDWMTAGVPLNVIRAATNGTAESLDPADGAARVLELEAAGFAEDDLVAWVRRVQFTKPFTSSHMLAWKEAGVPQAAIRAAME